MRIFAHIISIGCLALATTANADALAGTSADPVGELNTIYKDICQWTDGQAIPAQTLDFNQDNLDDFLLTYDVPCRGINSAFAGTAGMARQLWLGTTDDVWIRVMDVNARSLEITSFDGTPQIVLQHQGSYCMTADAAPCFLTLELKNNELVWAENQHPSMTARLAQRQKGTDQ